MCVLRICAYLMPYNLANFPVILAMHVRAYDQKGNPYFYFFWLFSYTELKIFIWLQNVF